MAWVAKLPFQPQKIQRQVMGSKVQVSAQQSTINILSEKDISNNRSTEPLKKNIDSVHSINQT